MNLSRKNVEFSKRVFFDRLGVPYDYGNDYDPFNLRVGADCSGSNGIFIGAALLGPDHMSWTRQFSTETFPGGFKGFRTTSREDSLNGNYPIKVNIHHGGGGPNSHMQMILDGVVMESNGSHGTCTRPGGAMDPASDYWNARWVYDGVIVEDGTAPAQAPTEPSDTLWADVSYFQKPVDDSYWNATYRAGNGVVAKYRWLAIRSNDGGFRDPNFAINYQRCVQAVNDGRADGFFVYFYWRPGATDVDTHIAMVEAQGGPHPRMVSMIDLESGGNPRGDQSPELTAEYKRLTGWIGDQRRVIGYANVGDRRSMWQFVPDKVPFILAGYGSNPTDTAVFKIAHQYTDGRGFGGGLPEGAPPFGNCDMNSADGFTPTALAAVFGFTTGTPTPQDPIEELLMADTEVESWSIYATPGEPRIPLVNLVRAIDAATHRELVENAARLGDVDSINRIARVAAGQGKYTDAASIAHAKAVLAQIEATSPDYIRAALAQKGA